MAGSAAAPLSIGAASATTSAVRRERFEMGGNNVLGVIGVVLTAGGGCVRGIMMPTNCPANGSGPDDSVRARQYRPAVDGLRASRVSAGARRSAFAARW